MLPTAPGIAAIGAEAKFAVASVQARPVFCIPTSIARAFLLAIGSLKNFATAKPKP